jgi:hypothetical protein
MLWPQTAASAETALLLMHLTREDIAMRVPNVLAALLASSLLTADDAKRPLPSHSGLSEFEANVRQYMELRKTAAKSLPKLKEKADPAAIFAYEQAMAQAIRKARPAARPGDIITPAARKYFQTLTMKQVRAPGGTAVKDTIEQGNPQADKEGADVKLQVNGTYPKAAPQSTMPASLLARLPRLPEELQYRFVGRTLILLDTAANLIVDYAPQVGPSL